MKPLTVVAPYNPGPFFEETLTALTESALVEKIVVVNEASHETLKSILKRVSTEYLLLVSGVHRISIEREDLEAMLEHAGSTRAGLIYSDFYEISKQGRIYHPLTDYQPGSVRDDFDFGCVMLFSMPAVRSILKTNGEIPSVTFAGLYDLRLKLSIEHSLHHVREPLYSVTRSTERSGDEQLFAYVDSRNEAAQKEMEAVFTDYLKNIGAYLAPHQFKEVKPTAD